jgi:thioredoxin-disulfide reductase
MPTFQFWLNGKKMHQFSGADERSVREWTRKLVDKADKEDVVVTREALEEFYKKHDPSKATKESIDLIIKKNEKNFGTMVNLLKKKYGAAPEVTPKPSKKSSNGGSSSAGKSSSPDTGAPNLKKATLEELRQELQNREEELEDEKLVAEERRLSNNPCSLYRNRTKDVIEKVVIIGGGPGGFTAALYAARASLCPLLIAPAIGGQLMAKGVDVENYPGMPLENGGKMVQIMKTQARSFFTEVWDDTVVDIDMSKRPFIVRTNSSGEVMSHTVILATGAESKWLEIEGEWEYRGHGVSSCAVCDGALFKGKPCAVVGGGDTAMEEALYLTRVCSSVTVIHRRSEFRASKVLQQRVIENPSIEIRWNTEVASFHGKTVETDGEPRTSLTHIMLRSKENNSSSLETFEVDATFVAIGHNPNTHFLRRSQVELDESGYVVPQGRGSHTSTKGLFVAGDVADHTYRQAVTSAGSGAMAALDAERYLSENPPDETKCVRQEDFSTWSLKEVVTKFKTLGMTCKGCTDKSEYIKQLRAVF